MRSEKLIVVLFGWTLMASAALCQDKGWTVAHYDPHMEIWVQRPVGEPPTPGSIWVQAQYSPRLKMDGFKYASERYLAEVDCDQGRINRLQWRQFWGPKFDGKSRQALTNSGVSWLIIPDTVDDWIAEAACPKTPPGAPATR